MSGQPLLSVRDLHVSFHTQDGVVKAVDGVDRVAGGDGLDGFVVAGEAGHVVDLELRRILLVQDERELDAEDAKQFN